MAGAIRKLDHEGYTPFGGAAVLFRCLDSEVLIEGAAGTGKTLAVLQKAHMLCEMYPGIRVLFIRKTLKSLRESVLVTWEEEVLGPGHPAITGTATRQHRDSYTFPNRSHVVLAGIDTPSRHMSTQFDFVCIYEAAEVSENDFEYLLTRNRNWVMPFQQVVCDTNPRQPSHWLNKRPERPVRVSTDERLPKPPVGARQMTRIKSKHEDNPFLYDRKKKAWTVAGADYMRKLEGLHGPRYAWFREGLWKAAEGMVLPMWDPDIHMVMASEVPDLGWYCAGLDFGFAGPGCFQVWGFTGRQDQPFAEQRGYRVAEVYRKGWTIEEWARVIMELRQEYPFRVGVCDAADPGSIKFLNDYLGPGRARAHAGLFRPVDKGKGVAAGLRLLQSVLANEPPREEDGVFYPGGPRAYFVRDAFPYGLQAELRHDARETCWEDEVENYVYPEKDDGVMKDAELPDKRCADHAIDTTRYVWTWGWGRDMTPKPGTVKPSPGTYADKFGTVEGLWRDRLRAMARSRWR